MNTEVSLSSNYIVRYIKDLRNKDVFERITIEQAKELYKAGVDLKGHLFDIEDDNLPAKFVLPTYICHSTHRLKRAYFAAVAKDFNRAVSERKHSTDFHNRIVSYIVDEISSGRHFFIDNSMRTPMFDKCISLETEKSLVFDKNCSNGGFILRPDITFEFSTHIIFIEVFVTHKIDEDKANKYRLYRDSDDCDRSFITIELDFSDLVEKYKKDKWNSVVEEIDRRCFSRTNEHKHVLDKKTLYLDTKPFGVSKANLPYMMLVNTGADSISKECRDLLSNISNKYDSIYMSNLNTSDLDWNEVDKSEPSEVRNFFRQDKCHGIILCDKLGNKFYPKCPICGKDLYLTLNKTHNLFYIHCEDFQYQSNDDGTKLSDCDFNLTLCDADGNLIDTYYFNGDLTSILALGEDASIVIDTFVSQFRN